MFLNHIFCLLFVNARNIEKYIYYKLYYLVNAKNLLNNPEIIILSVDRIIFSSKYGYLCLCLQIFKHNLSMFFNRDEFHLKISRETLCIISSCFWVYCVQITGLLYTLSTLSACK